MAYLKTRIFPQSASGGHHWPDGDAIVDVPDSLATALLRISGAQFYEVLPGDLEHPGSGLGDCDPEPTGVEIQSAFLIPVDAPALGTPDETVAAEPPTHRRRERAPRTPSE